MNRVAFLVVVLLTCVALVGCGGQKAKDAAKEKPADAKAAPAHDHASTGPHGGHVIVLGDEKYHAELTHDEKAKTVTVYLLDGAVKNAVKADKPELTVTLFHAGKYEDHTLKAAGEPSTFNIVSEELSGDLDAGDKVTGRLVVEIGGEKFTGKIELEAHGEGGAADPHGHK